MSLNKTSITIKGEVAHLCAPAVLSRTFFATDTMTVRDKQIVYTLDGHVITDCPDCKATITKDRAVFINPFDLDIQ